MTEFDSEEEIDVEALEVALKAELERIEALQTKRAEVSTQLESVKRVFATLEKEKREIGTDLESARWDARQLERKRDNARRRALAKEEEQRLVAEFEKISKDLDELTADCVWRGHKDPKKVAFPHQIFGAKKLAVAKRGILADKRGLGKTLGGIIWLDMLQANKILLIAPNDVVEQFIEELQFWAPQRTIMNLSGLPPAQRTVMYGILPTMKQVICTINYESWRRDKTIVDSLVAAGFDSVLLDEAHRAKSADKITARGIFQVIYSKNKCSHCHRIEMQQSWMVGGKLKDIDPTSSSPKCRGCGNYTVQASVENVLSMTGTPLLNKPQEMFSLLYMVDPIRYPNENAFTYDFCQKAYGSNRWTFRPGGLDRLAKHMETFFVQRDRNSIGIKVPPPAIFKHELDFDRAKYPKQYKAYKDIVEAAAMVLQSGQKFSVFSILEMLTRMRQVITWPAGVIFRDPETKEILCNFDVEESQKVDAVDELLTELLEEGERVVIFSKFKEPLRVLQARYTKRSEYSTTMATGDQTDYHRKEVRMDFDLKNQVEGVTPKWNAVFATYEAFGTGINLNAAKHVIILDREWSGGKEDQAIGRIDRLNDTMQANVHIFEVKGTVDKFLNELIEHKRAMTEGFETTISAAEILKGITEGDV